MRAMGWLSVVVIAASCWASAGCGGSLESAHAEPGEHETDAMMARQWHDRVVRLEGEAGVAAQRDEPCPDRCAIAARACELGARICRLAERDDHDEGTRMLCEDARPRCDATRSMAGSCGCSG